MSSCPFSSGAHRREGFPVVVLPLVALTGPHDFAACPIVVAGDSAAADRASGPLAGASGVAARAAGASPVPVPVPVIGAWDTVYVGDGITLVPEKNDMIVARGAAAAATGGVEAADSFGPL